MTDTDTCARCTLTIGYDCGCTEIERLTAERDRYKARAERVREEALMEATTAELIAELCRRPSNPPKTGVTPRPLIEKDKTDE